MKRGKIVASRQVLWAQKLSKLLFEVGAPDSAEELTALSRNLWISEPLCGREGERTAKREGTVRRRGGKNGRGKIPPRKHARSANEDKVA